MTKLAPNVASVIAAIERLNQFLPQNPELADRLGQVHAFYAYEKPNGDTLFGFSKFVGYDGLTDVQYLKQSKKLNGINTEHLLAKWFDEVKEGSPSYNTLYDKLSDWLAQYGKKPRGGKKQRARIMVIKPEFLQPVDFADQNRRLLELMLAVADLLPTHQRHELRAAL